MRTFGAVLLIVGFALVSGLLWSHGWATGWRDRSKK